MKLNVWRVSPKGAPGERPCRFCRNCYFAQCTFFVGILGLFFILTLEMVCWSVSFRPVRLSADVKPDLIFRQLGFAWDHDGVFRLFDGSAHLSWVSCGVEMCSWPKVKSQEGKIPCVQHFFVIIYIYMRYYIHDEGICMHPVLQVHETFANIQLGVAPVLPRCHLTAMFLEVFEGDFHDPAKDMQINFLFLHTLDFIHSFD